ncbi:hypothetical protein I4641_23025 [Waterburya agarophytonicola K14]|uniref:Uncharacterized protein n=1 Tax=Waterburya agarophytonicola KI4 TaxID=2874699 RepID=A0A964FHA7_9CYAN|nr:hypothetical protein [Waterburya agarophytonicola]MCC0179815.1 hypothetical protein [Waterburya agarophytonicola KI4]
MLELKEALEQRLAVLRGESVKSDSKAITNTSKEYITHTLIQAGILDEHGEIIELEISEEISE